MITNLKRFLRLIDIRIVNLKTLEKWTFMLAYFSKVFDIHCISLLLISFSCFSR